MTVGEHVLVMMERVERSGWTQAGLEALARETPQDACIFCLWPLTVAQPRCPLGCPCTLVRA